MTTSATPLPWDTSQAAQAYRDRDMRLARELIFPTVLERLSSVVPTDGKVLDVGCGTGALTLYLAQAQDWSVHGLDISAAMLGIAGEDREHPRVHYRHFDGRGLDWIEDGTVDAVVSCLVYCTDADDQRLAALTREIRRVLRPGAPFVLADLNPGAIGERFSTLRYGETGVDYADGAVVPTELRQLSGTTVTTACHYRSLTRYRAFFTEAGFMDPALDLPLSTREGAPASRVAPYMVLTAHAG